MILASSDKAFPYRKDDTKIIECSRLGTFDSIYGHFMQHSHFQISDSQWSGK